MPARKLSDLQSILILGSGPIVIGLAGEFDYSGTQAVRALREERYRMIVVNSKPSMTINERPGTLRVVRGSAGSHSQWPPGGLGKIAISIRPFLIRPKGELLSAIGCSLSFPTVRIRSTFTPADATYDATEPARCSGSA
jgi:hypothetical protein